MKHLSIFVIILLLSFVSVHADNNCVVLTPGQNNITLSVTNNYFADLSNLTVHVDNEELPGWLTVADVIDAIDIPRGGDSAKKINIMITVGSDAGESAYTIPLNISDDIGNTWNFLIPVAVNSSLPCETALFDNYPNPFNPATSIGYSLKSNMHARLEIYNTLGQKVRTLINGMQSQGSHTVRWDGKNEAGQSVSSGVYFYRLSAGSFVQTRRMMFVE